MYLLAFWWVLKGHSADLWTSLFVGLFTFIPCPVNFSLLWPSQTPSSISSTWRECWVTAGFPLSVPSNFLLAVSWGNQRAHFICFLFVRDHYFSFPDFQCLQKCFMYFVSLFSCFRWKGKSCSSFSMLAWTESL